MLLRSVRIVFPSSFYFVSRYCSLCWATYIVVVVCPLLCFFLENVDSRLQVRTLVHILIRHFFLWLQFFDPRYILFCCYGCSVKVPLYYPLHYEVTTNLEWQGRDFWSIWRATLLNDLERLWTYFYDVAQYNCQSSSKVTTLHFL